MPTFESTSSIVPPVPPGIPQPFPGIVFSQPQPAAKLSSTVVVKFFADVNPATAQQLMQALDNCHRQGVSDIVLMISTGGGSVHHGVSLYNFIRGLNANVSTHNFGSVDSIGVALFAAGRTRTSARQARFLIHRASLSIPQPTQVTDEQLAVARKNLQTDEGNIARIIAENSNRTERQVLATMRAQDTLLPDQAKAWGLVHEVKDFALPGGADLLTIQ